MSILLHRTSRTRKIIPVEICGNVFHVSAPEVVREAHQSVELILGELGEKKVSPLPA